MAEVVIEVSKEFKEEIGKPDSFMLSLALQKAIADLSEWAEVKRIVPKSKLTEKDALKLGRKVNKGMAKITQARSLQACLALGHLPILGSRHSR